MATNANSAAVKSSAKAWARPPVSAIRMRSIASLPTRSSWIPRASYKADIGIKHGLISGIGKAGNPDVMAGVTQGMIVGVTTEVIAGEGLILTAGGFDAHIHFICPQQAHEAIASGLTTMVGRRHRSRRRHLRDDLHSG